MLPRWHHCFSAALMFSSSIACGQALINGNFEQPGQAGASPIGWSVLSGTFIQDPQMRFEGAFSGKIDNYNRSSGVFQDVQVTPGQTYLLKGRWRNGDKTAPFDVARIEWHWLSQVGGKPIAQEPMIDSGTIVSDWKQFEMGPFTAPPNVNAVRISLKSTYGIAAFDDLSFLRTSSAGASAPANAPPATGMIQWIPDATSAMALAAQDQKRILLFFSSKAGETAQHYLSDVFTHPGVVQYINENYLAVNCDLTATRDLALKLGVVKSGTTLTFDSGGKPLKTIQGKLTPEQFLEEISSR